MVGSSKGRCASRAAAVVLPILFLAQSAAGDTLTFDNLTAQTNPVGETITDGYGGLNWQNMGYINGTLLPTTGYHTGRVSGDYVAFNQFARVAAATDIPFTLNSAYFTAAHVPLLDVMIDGYIGEAKIASTVVTVNRSTPTLVTFDWAGLTKVSFMGYTSQTTTPEWFAMDNFRINEPTVAAAVVTPLPAAACGAIALMGFIGAKRARRSAQLTYH